MPTLQERYDDAMYAFTKGDLEGCIDQLKQVLAQDPAYFDAQLSLGMAYYRQGEYPAAVREGLKAEQMNPKDQLVHTNLSLFYLKAGDKAKAEHHGAQARIASWRGASANPARAGSTPPAGPPSSSASPGPEPASFPDMPWKRKTELKESP